MVAGLRENQFRAQMVSSTLRPHRSRKRKGDSVSFGLRRLTAGRLPAQITGKMLSEQPAPGFGSAGACRSEAERPLPAAVASACDSRRRQSHSDRPGTCRNELEILEEGTLPALPKVPSVPREAKPKGTTDEDSVAPVVRSVNAAIQRHTSEDSLLNESSAPRTSAC